MPYTLKNKHFINQLLFGTQVVESAREEVLHGNGNYVETETSGTCLTGLVQFILL